MTCLIFELKMIRQRFSLAIITTIVCICLQLQLQLQHVQVQAYQHKITGATHQYIVLNMIVKNEMAVMERCLNSTVKMIDAYVILDTGSTDGTQNFIRQFFTKHKIPGQVLESPFINFQHNRNIALNASRDFINVSMEQGKPRFPLGSLPF